MTEHSEEKLRTMIEDFNKHRGEHTMSQLERVLYAAKALTTGGRDGAPAAMMAASTVSLALGASAPG